RLDHLLSKEHTLRTPRYGADCVSSWVLKGGTSQTHRLPTQPGWGHCPGCGWCGWAGTDTLLGPGITNPNSVGCGFNQRDRPGPRAAMEIGLVVGGVW